MKITVLATFVVMAIFQCFAQPSSTPSPTPSWAGLIFNAIIDKKEITVAINCPEKRTPTQFLRLGDTIPNTKYKIIGFIPGSKSPMFILEREDKKYPVEVGKLVWIDL